MPNNTSCSVTGTCMILTGTVTNGTDYVAQYNPNAPAPLWHQRMELATICVCNVLSCKATIAKMFSSAGSARASMAAYCIMKYSILTRI